MSIKRRLYKRQLARLSKTLPLVQRADQPLTVQGPKLALHDFVARAWDKIPENSTREFVDNWHIEEIAGVLEQVSRGEITNLGINIPPGHMKSLLSSVFFPAWVWTYDPSKQFLCVTNDHGLAKRDARRMRDLIRSSWYQSMWPHVMIKSDHDAVLDFANTSGGFRQSQSVGSNVTGARADFRIIDDAHDAEGVKSDVKRAQVISWYKTAFANRKKDAQAGAGEMESATIAIGQRLHDDDLFKLFEEFGFFEWIILPSRFTGEHRSTCVEDPRTEKGQLLFEARFNEETLRKNEIELGPVDFAAQHQQEPVAEGGTIFNEADWKFWRYSPAEKIGTYKPERFGIRPNNFDIIMLSVDCAFKDTASSSFVVIQVWGGRGADAYLLDQERRQMGFSATVEAIRTVYAMWPDIHAVLVEDKANGPAVIETMTDEIIGLLPVEPKGGKEVRANAVTYQIRSGHVYLPNPVTHAWMSELLMEHRKFPRYRTDDQVDALTQALVHLRRHAGKILIGSA